MFFAPFRRLQDIDSFFEEDDLFTELEESLSDDLAFDSSEVPYFGTLTLDMLHRLLVPMWKKTHKMVEGETILHYALKQTNQSTLRMLIEEHGQDVEMLDGRRNSPLHVAVNLGLVQSVATLIRAGADINKRNADGITALQIAAKEASEMEDTSVNFRHIIYLLLGAGADINAITVVTSRTALHIACIFGNVKEALPLLQCGAAHSMLDRFGCTPLHFAARHGSHRDIVALLMAFGASANVYNYANTSALHDACTLSDDPESILLVMVCFDVDLGQLDNEGSSVLHNADMDRNLMDALVNNMEDDLDLLDLENRSGNTPIHHMAIRYRKEGNVIPPEVLRSMELLLKHGASILHKNQVGMTIFDTSTMFNLHEVIALLNTEVRYR